VATQEFEHAENRLLKQQVIADKLWAPSRVTTTDEARHDLSSFFNTLHDRSTQTDWQQGPQQQSLQLHAVPSSMMAAKAAAALLHETYTRVSAAVAKFDTDTASLVSSSHRLMYDIFEYITMMVYIRYI
jgi:hypothetical protein